MFKGPQGWLPFSITYIESYFQARKVLTLETFNPRRLCTPNIRPVKALS